MTHTETLEGFQLSQQQLRCWLLQARQEGHPFSARITVEIDGPLDRNALQNAIDRVVSRHEILRTTFRRLPGMLVPVQVIGEPAPVAIEEQEGESEFSDSGEDLPLRVGLRRLSSQRHRLTLEASSLCADATTLCNLVTEIAQRYSAPSEWEEPGVPMQYADYAAWQADAAQTHSTKGAEQGSPRPDPAAAIELTLPFEKKRASTVFKAGIENTEFDPETVRMLDGLAQELDCPVSNLWLAAWMILLGRLANAPSVCVAAGMDGRVMPELAAAAGPYASLAAVRCGLEGSMPVQRLVEELNENLRRAYESQGYFAGEKVESVANTPALVSPVAFDYIESPPVIAAKELSFRVLEVSACAEPFRLKLVCVRQDRSLRGELHYDRGTCDADAAQRLLEEVGAVARGLAGGLSAKVGELPVVGPKEYQLLTEGFNGPAKEIPAVCIHALIEAEVQRNPDRCAVVCGEAQITYRELNLRANHLAATLQKHGVRAETPVALCVDRSIEMVVGILAILKAGGCYVPLDPGYPIDRLKFMVEDCGAKVLLTRRDGPRLDISGTTLYFEDPESAQAGPRVGIPIDKAKPHDTAYIIYTSGSTGKPKGVPVSHRNLVHSTLARTWYYREPIGSYLLLSSFAFDSSVAGIFWTLCGGGQLVLPTGQAHQDPAEINRLIARHSVTHLLCLPSLYRHLLETPTAGLSSLRVAIVAGETCQAEVVRLHRRVVPQAALYNEYGPTEGTVWSTVYECTAGEPANGSVPIGKPIANTRVYVLDSNRKPVPIQVPGEIYLGGAGIAQGYLNRPELTVQKFVPDMFHPDPAARLYRTGDMGRFLPDGNLEFLGRIDQQVKIRGYRVELDEIEALLRQHIAIKDAVVMLENGSLSPDSQPESLAAAMEDLDAAENLLLAIEARNGAADAESAGTFHRNGEGSHRAEPEVVASAASESSGDRWVQRRPAFDVTVDIKERGFIQPPRASQRQWLINRALAELSEDLESLDALAERFVPGTDLGTEVFSADRSQGQLSDDEIIQDWHAPLMESMARVLNVAGRDVLEIGFGRGMAAGFLQRDKPRSHTIIDCNDFIIEHHFLPWREKHASADIRLVKGKWQEVIGSLPAFDAIFFQTYPLNEAEFVEYLARSVTFAEHFFPAAVEHLRPGGAFTYLSHEIDSLSRRHQRLLFKYFSSFEACLQPLRLPEDCKDLWWADSMLVIKAIK